MPLGLSPARAMEVQDFTHALPHTGEAWQNVSCFSRARVHHSGFTHVKPFKGLNCEGYRFPVPHSTQPRHTIR